MRLSCFPPSWDRRHLFSIPLIVLVLLVCDTSWAFAPLSVYHARHQNHRHHHRHHHTSEQQSSTPMTTMMLLLKKVVAGSSRKRHGRTFQTSIERQSQWIKQQQWALSNSPNDYNNNSKDDDSSNEDLFFQGKTTISLIAGQGLLVIAAVVAALLLHIPNFGLGLSFVLTWPQVQASIVATLPLVLIAFILDWFEPRVPWLQDVTVATQRSILALLGGTWKPALAVGVSLLLSLAAGIGEEILFRGVLQYELISRWNDVTAGLLVSSIVFGALHAVTPLYAIMATLASLYFGWLFLHFDNLAIPMVTHALYDFGAILYAHYTISKLSPAELDDIYNWEGPGSTTTTTTPTTRN